MLTTGFNSKHFNTIYLDCELKNYDIIQTISRTNRLYDESKNVANIVFRTYKKDVDEAIAIYCNKNSSLSVFLKETLEELMGSVNIEIKEMLSKWKNYHEVLKEKSETRLEEFIAYMKIINRLLNLARNFIEYEDNMIDLTKYQLAEFKSAQNEIAKRVEKIFIITLKIKTICIKVKIKLLIF